MKKGTIILLILLLTFCQYAFAGILDNYGEVGANDIPTDCNSTDNSSVDNSYDYDCSSTDNSSDYDSSTTINIGGDGTVVIISGDGSSVAIPGDEVDENNCPICKPAIFDANTGALIIPNVVAEIDGLEIKLTRLILMLDETTGQFRLIWFEQEEE